MERELPSQATLLVTVVEAHHSEDREMDLLADAVAQSGACLDPDTIFIPTTEGHLHPVGQTGEAELAQLEIEAAQYLSPAARGGDLQLSEQQLSEQQLPEQQMSDQQPPEQQLPEQQMSDQQPPEQQMSDQQPPEQQMSDQQPFEQQPPEQQMSDQQPPEQQMSDQQMSDQQPPEQQPPEQQMSDQQPPEEQPPEQQMLHQQLPEEQPSGKQPTAVSQTLPDEAGETEPSGGTPVDDVPESHKPEEVVPTLPNGEMEAQEGPKPPEQPPKPTEETPSRYKPAMLKLMAMLASQEPPTPTKSLPSKMERLTFRNSTPARKVPKKAKACKTYYRQQNTSPRACAPTYACQKCSFRTSRMDNLVRHNKTDCAFVKDFFSWDANTFTEATQLPKKRSLSPDTNGGVVAGMAETSVPMPKRKGVPRRRLELSSKPSDRRKSAPGSQSKSQPESVEDGSDPEDELGLSSTPHEELEFSEDDVVWVEWKRLHWPALVLKLYPSTRKAKVFLIDSITSKETVMINVKKIFDFNSAERTKRFLNEGRVGCNSGALVKAVQKAEEFLRKRCLGININARQFFCDEEVRLTEGPPSEASDDSYMDCSPASPEESGNQGGDTLLEAAQASKERRRLRNEKLVDCIKGGKVNSHLLGILNGTVPSERHKRFHSNVQSDRIQLKQWSWFGPIDNTSQQEEIYEFCFELLKANSDLDDTFDIASYVIEVWCPEAVMKALCRVRRVQMDRAEEILLRAVVPSAAEYEVKCRELLSIPPTPEEKREHNERLRAEFRDLGIADDILAALDF